MKLPEDYINELENEDQEYWDELNQFKKEPLKGEWTVVYNKSSVHIYCDDFTYDAGLELSGDFIDIEYKKAYAKKIADLLNSL